MKDLFIEMLDDFSNATGRQTPDIITEKVASMSCKAAVKGNDKLTLPEINKLIDELLHSTILTTAHTADQPSSL